MARNTKYKGRINPLNTNEESSVVSDYFNDLIDRGFMFAITKRFTIAAGATLTLVLDPTGCSCTTLDFLPVGYIATGGPITIDFYAGTDADADGTAFTITNRNLTSSNTSDMVFQYDPTINNIGTKGAEFLVPADGLAATAKAGGGSKDDLKTVLSTSTKYAITITNTDTTTETVHVTFNWVEK